MSVTIRLLCCSVRLVRFRSIICHSQSLWKVTFSCHINNILPLLSNIMLLCLSNWWQKKKEPKPPLILHPKPQSCPCCLCLHLPVTGADTDASFLKRLGVWKPDSELFEAAATAWQRSSQLLLHLTSPVCVLCACVCHGCQYGADRCSQLSVGWHSA